MWPFLAAAKSGAFILGYFALAAASALFLLGRTLLLGHFLAAAAASLAACGLLLGFLGGFFLRRLFLLSGHLCFSTTVSNICIVIIFS